MSRDFVLPTAHIETDGAEAFTLGPQRIRDVADDALDLVRVSSCGGVEVDGRRVHRIG